MKAQVHSDAEGADELGEGLVDTLVLFELSEPALPVEGDGVDAPPSED